MAYTLKLFDEPLLDFEMASKGRDLIVEVTYVHAGSLTKLPPDWESAKDADSLPDDLAKDLASWLARRSIPANRAYVGNFLAKLGLSEHDVEGIIRICKGLSLNDCFWVVESRDPSTFAKSNLYDNPFSRIVSRIAFTGSGSSRRRSFYSTPELTTNGALAKCWRRIDGEIFLFKEGTTGARNTGNEPLSEFYAAQVAQAMGIAHIPYVPTKWNGHFCSKCPLFTSKDTGFVSAGRLVREGGIDAVRAYYRRLGSVYAEAFADMIVFDAVAYNTDRHFGNFGFLLDNKSSALTAPAPLFDHGLSLFPFAMEDDYADIDSLNQYAQTLLPRTYDDFEAKAAEVMGPRQREKLRKLLSFSFKRHPRYNWPKERLATLEAFVRQQARLLLNQ